MNEISSRADAAEIVRHDSEQVGEGREAHSANIAGDEWLRLLLPAARAGLWDMDLVSKRVTWSPEMYELCGRDAALGPPTYEEAHELLHPADRLRAQENVEHVVAGGERGRAFDIECRIQRSDGATVWLSSSGHEEHDERGQPIRILGISRDITARKQAEQAHREGEEFIRKITELTPDLIVVYDRNDGRTIYSNRSFAKMLGYGAEQAHHTFDTFIRQTIHPDDVERLTAIRRSLQFLADNVTIQYECRFRHADGTWRWFQTRITPLRATATVASARPLGPPPMSPSVDKPRRSYADSMRSSSNAWRRALPS